MTLIQALLIGLTYFLANTAFLAGLSYFTTWRPLVSGLLVGLILGDPFRGAILGAAINLLYVGYVSVGGQLGNGDGALAGVIGTAFGIVANSQGLGVLAGALIAGLGYQLLSWRMRGDNLIARRVDAAAARGDVRAMFGWHVLAAQAWLALLTIVPVALMALLMPPVAAALHALAASSTLGSVILDGIALGGRLAPALGIALALKFVFVGPRAQWLHLVLFVAGAVWTALILPFWALAGLCLIAIVTRAASQPAAAATPAGAHPIAGAWRSFWLWQFFSHSSYSFERLQGSGLAMALAPALRNDPAALKRHGGFFNTEVNLGALIPAVILRMTRDGADAESIDNTRQTLMGAIAGFGDALIQGAFLPVVMAAAIGLVFSGFGAFAVAGFVIVICALMLGISIYSFQAGLSQGRAAATVMLASPRLKAAADASRAVLALLLGALAANSAVLHLPMPLYGLPSLLRINAVGAVALTLICYVCVRNSAVKPWWVLCVLVALALAFQLAQSLLF